MSRPEIPLPVKRQLRQESYFGCAKCGNPILDYHHIIPWSERQHFEPDHMVALCPSCHRHVGKLSREWAYELKETPYNEKNKSFQGELGTNAKITSFLVGSNTYENTPVIFSYYSHPIISYRIIEGQLCISAKILGRDLRPEIQIVNNDIIAKIDKFWDIEHRTNYLRFKKRQNQTFLEIDLRKQPALISARFRFGNDVIEFSPKETNIAGRVSITNCDFSNCEGGIQFGSGNLMLPKQDMQN